MIASLEQRLVAAALRKLRPSREAQGVDEAQLDHHVDRPHAKPAKLREARFSDFPGVAELKQRWGLGEDSLENWNHLWRDNPALCHVQTPMGWVLEAEGRIVGYLGNIPLLYRYGGKTLIAATASGFVAESKYRAISFSLVSAFYRQKSVDLYLTTTANESTGKLAQAFGSDPLPQADFDKVLFWILRPHPYCRAVMKNLNMPRVLTDLSAFFASLALHARRVVRRRRPRVAVNGLEIKEMAISEIGDEFHDLWMHKVRETPRLLADRSPSILQWHFQAPGDTRTARVICCYKSAELLGYLVIRDDRDQAGGLRRSLVSDLLVRDDDSEVIQALCTGAYAHAKCVGSHVLELQGFPEKVRSAFSKSKPFMRKYPSSPFYYKAEDRPLHAALAGSSSWYASPFDGDTTFHAPRPIAFS
jgi:hypothetical protein